ncbi:tetratricopeptide repeat protein [Plastorhodobacter daqingensis]|uniref:Tetratricopeptide repeat protein n=1 Tax=Plastorhodobacter daqingensis TaxID=1387281 RepID=A0ABW2UK25_9RHOB
MSNSESFIDEVTEEVRRERLFGYLRRYGWIAVLLILVLVGAAAWNEWQKAQNRAAAEAFGDSVLAALLHETPDARREALAEVPTTGAQGGVVALLQASEAMAAGDSAAALAALDAVAADGALPASYRQLAMLKRVVLGGADLPAEEREAALQGLAQAGQPFRPLALEQLALLRIEAGDTDAAIALLRDVLQEPGLTANLRRRAMQLIVVLGENPEAAG